MESAVFQKARPGFECQCRFHWGSGVACPEKFRAVVVGSLVLGRLLMLLGVGLGS